WRPDRNDQPQQDSDRDDGDQRPCRMALDKPAHETSPAAVAVPRRASANASISAACLAIDVHPPKARRDRLSDRVLGILTVAKGRDLIESIFIASGILRLRMQHLGRAAVIGR